MSDPLTTDLLSIPGPWRLDDPSNAHVLEDNDGYHVIEGDGPTEHLRLTGFIPLDVARAITAVPELLASLKEMGDWIAAGLQASDEAWPDERCLKHTEEIAARARAAVDKAEGRS